ncbi:MAG: FecR domain-containing protein [Gallionella sp.]
MRFQRIDLLLQIFISLIFLASTCGSAWAVSGTCDYPKPVTEINDASIGGTGMGGTGAVAKGTGMDGTGVSPEAEQSAIRLAGNVIYSQGMVEAKSDGRSRQLAKGDPVCVGETIVTSQSGKLQIKMTDDGLVAIRPGTQLKIEQYAYSGSSDDTSVFALLRGASRFVTGNIGKRNPQKDLIRTQTATIGVRGTDHEATVILSGEGSGFVSGTYDKVNTGVTFIRTEIGEIDIHPNEVGLAADIGKMPILLKDIPDFYTTAPYMKEEGSLSEAGQKEEGMADQFRERSTPEQSGKETGLDHPSGVGTSPGEHSGNRIDMEHPESHSQPELPESPSIPNVPESPSLPELPESPSVPELQELPDIPEIPELEGD